MAKKKTVKINLSEHTLDINVRKCNYAKFNFSDIEEYVRELTGSREYQYDAIKKIMIYLWGGSYGNIVDLAKENWTSKRQLHNRFHTEEIFLSHMPLPNRLSGVVHMATGTGKSYVIFAVAYLSIVMGYVKRVLILGPSSTVIEQGLNKKIKELVNKPELVSKLPTKYKGIPVSIVNQNQVVEDNTIMIENINAIYNKEKNAIGDTLFNQTDEVLVLGDEIHHAYTHLKFFNNRLQYDFDEDKVGTGEARDERLWMKFLRAEPKIKRHIGFTGTPYNQDEYFADVIYNYSIKDATEDKYIKKINAIIKTEAGDEGELTSYQRFEMILQNHFKNKEKYAYKNGHARVKPITIFICRTQKSAQAKTEEFINFLAEYEQKNSRRDLSLSEYQGEAREKVICVISNPGSESYQEELEKIEELNPRKVGGKVEFIFAVNKLSEGWDVENVFQIVPMEERAFNSKLLISQVLGRGLRLPEKSGVPMAHIHSNYPVVTVTNHDRFADHIQELVDAVTECDIYLHSNIIKQEKLDREKYNFTLFNMNYLPQSKTEKVTNKEQMETSTRQLILTPFKENIDVNVIRMLDNGRYELSRNLFTIDQIVSDIANRFKMHEYEKQYFDFGGLVVDGHLPNEEDIEEIIREAMKVANIKGDKLSKTNRQQINLFFNQYLPRSKKKRVFTNIEGDIEPVSTKTMGQTSVRASELVKESTVFLSENYEEEIGPQNLSIIDYIEQTRIKKSDSAQASLYDVGTDTFIQKNGDIIRAITQDNKSPYIVNTSKLKSPQDLISVTHEPERLFVFKLIEYSEFIDAWVKSPDMSFYSIDYEFWKGGKDRTRRSFNPDFFIKIDLDSYISRVRDKAIKEDLEKLEKLKDQGINTLIRTVEIKSNDDKDETTPRKAEYARDHFQRLNTRLQNTSPGDLLSEFQGDIRQYYTFDILIPKLYDLWFNDLINGRLYDVKDLKL